MGAKVITCEEPGCEATSREHAPFASNPTYFVPVDGWAHLFVMLFSDGGRLTNILRWWCPAHAAEKLALIGDGKARVAEPPRIGAGKTPTLMQHRSTGIRLEWFDTDWSRGRPEARALVKKFHFGAPPEWMPLDALDRDYAVIDDGSWGAAFSIYASHARGCKVCKEIDGAPVPMSPCDAGLPLWTEYVRRFDAKAQAR